MSANSSGSLKKELRAALTPNPILSIFLAGLLALIAATFIFEEGKYKSPNIAEILRTIGIGALAAAITGIVDHNLLFKSFESRIRESLKEAKNVAAALTALGVENAHLPMRFNTIFEEAHPGDTISWLDTYSPSQNEFLNELSAAINRNVSIRMLVIDPACENAKNRSIELIGTPDSGKAFDDSLRAFISKMEVIAAGSGGRLQIRFYQDLPCIPMYLIGTKGQARKAFFSLFLSRATAQCTHMEISDGEWLSNMDSYFEAKWQRWATAKPSQPIPHSQPSQHSPLDKHTSRHSRASMPEGPGTTPPLL